MGSIAGSGAHISLMFNFNSGHLGNGFESYFANIEPNCSLFYFYDSTFLLFIGLVPDCIVLSFKMSCYRLITLSISQLK